MDSGTSGSGYMNRKNKQQNLLKNEHTEKLKIPSPNDLFKRIISHIKLGCLQIAVFD